jgi:AcrR family transcriptional regulator
MTYQRPKQSRAEQTEKRILDAYGQLLLLQSYHDTTVGQIADAAAVSHGAFMTRFGSKRNALGRLFELFCDDVYLVLDRLRKASSPVNAKILDYLMSVSKEYEALVILHWGANRAMHEIFLKEGVIDDQTKGIFKATVAALHPKFCEILQQDLPIERSFAAIQLMVTVNYNHVLGAMPGLPQKDDERHGLIGETMVAALQ